MQQHTRAAAACVNHSTTAVSQRIQSDFSAFYWQEAGNGICQGNLLSLLAIRHSFLADCASPQHAAAG